jgi:hypothetical protein
MIGRSRLCFMRIVRTLAVVAALLTGGAAFSSFAHSKAEEK